MAFTAASFIASLMVVAPTSSAPRKMKGKQRTLLTWFGKSERPVAITASGRAAFARSGMPPEAGAALEAAQKHKSIEMPTLKDVKR